MESPPPVPLATATVAFTAPGSGLGTFLGCGIWILAGRREKGRGLGGPSAKPRPRPQVRPAGGGGNFRSALGEARGGSSARRRGRRRLPRPPGEGEADPPWSLPSPLTNSFRILWPREPEGRTRLGEGRHVGGRTPVSAVGEGAVGRASRSPGCAAQSRACGPRAAGIPGRGASEANEFPAAGAGTAPAGGGEHGLGTLEPLYPANQGKRGVDPQ